MCKTDKREVYLVPIIDNKKIGNQLFEMTVEQRNIAESTRPGQFINLYCREESAILPRPISICKVDKKQGRIKIVYAVVGKGTKEFSTLRPGEHIRITGPFGNGFQYSEEPKNHVIVGGGVGIPPLLELAKNLKGTVKIFLGYKDEIFLAKEFEPYGKVHVATETGKIGFYGNVVEMMDRNQIYGDMIYACGPKTMLAAVQHYAQTLKIPGQLSLEERMGCGIGACVGCVCKIKDTCSQGWTYKKVCQDGPVFEAQEVIF